MASVTEELKEVAALLERVGEHQRKPSEPEPATRSKRLPRGLALVLLVLVGLLVLREDPGRQAPAGDDGPSAGSPPDVDSSAPSVVPREDAPPQPYEPSSDEPVETPAPVEESRQDEMPAVTRLTVGVGDVVVLHLGSSELPTDFDETVVDWSWTDEGGLEIEGLAPGVTTSASDTVVLQITVPGAPVAVEDFAVEELRALEVPDGFGLVELEVDGGGYTISKDDISMVEVGDPSLLDVYQQRSEDGSLGDLVVQPIAPGSTTILVGETKLFFKVYPPG